MKNNYTKRKSAKVTILTCIKQETKRKQRTLTTTKTTTTKNQQQQQNMAKSG